MPAAYDEVLTVTAIADFNGQPGGGAAQHAARMSMKPADFSNFTTTDNLTDPAHTIAAPGVCITSTWKSGGYKTISGTSMASPHAAGAVTTCIASNLCVGTPSDIIQQFRSDAAAKPAGTRGYGFLGDPSNPLTSGKGASLKTLYYGHLIFGGGY